MAAFKFSFVSRLLARIAAPWLGSSVRALRPTGHPRDFLRRAEVRGHLWKSHLQARSVGIFALRFQRLRPNSIVAMREMAAGVAIARSPTLIEYPAPTKA